MTTTNELRSARCEACEGGVPPMGEAEIEAHLQAVPLWTRDGQSIVRDLKLRDFAEALAYVNVVGGVAEEQGHHPDILIHGWNRVRLRLSTHAIGGLSRNDFVLAARLDALPER